MGVYVPALTYTAAASLDEALASLGEHPGARLLAGGHDLVPDMKAGRAAPPMLVDLRKIAGLREVSIDHATDKVRIGAMATLNQLAGDTELRRSAAGPRRGDRQHRRRPGAQLHHGRRHPGVAPPGGRPGRRGPGSGSGGAHHPAGRAPDDQCRGPAQRAGDGPRPGGDHHGGRDCHPADVGQRLRKAEEPRHPVPRRRRGGPGGADQQQPRRPVPGGGHRRVRTPDPPARGRGGGRSVRSRHTPHWRRPPSRPATPERA